MIDRAVGAAFGDTVLRAEDARVTAIPGGKRSSYGVWREDHERGSRRVPLPRDDGRSAEFAVPDSIVDPADLRRIASFVIDALEEPCARGRGDCAATWSDPTDRPGVSARSASGWRPSGAARGGAMCSLRTSISRGSGLAWLATRTGVNAAGLHPLGTHRVDEPAWGSVGR